MLHFQPHYDLSYWHTVEISRILKTLLRFPIVAVTTKLNYVLVPELNPEEL